MYSQNLIDEVKQCYPESKEMHRLAEEGNVFLGRYLDDGSNGSISLDDILKATKIEELQEMARKKKRKINCYLMWCEEDPRKTNQD